MRTVYTQDDAADLKNTGQAHRAAALIYITPIANGADVSVENAKVISGPTVAVASNGSKVWPLNKDMMDELQRAKRPSIKAPTPGGGQIKSKNLTGKKI